MVDAARCLALFAVTRLIDDPPKRRHCSRFGAKKILKESTAVERERVGIPLSLLASLRHPIARFGGVNNFKQPRWLEIRAALIVQNPEIISLNPNHDIRKIRGQIRISRVLTP